MIKHPATQRQSWDEQDFTPPSRSEEAARAAEHVATLERNATAMHKRIAFLEGIVEARDEEIKSLTANGIKLQSDRDYYHDRWITVWTTLSNSAKLLLDCMHEKPPEKPGAERLPPQNLVISEIEHPIEQPGVSNETS